MMLFGYGRENRLSYPFTTLAAQTFIRAEFNTGRENRTVFFRTERDF